MSMIYAPYTEEQVARLREWQASDFVHPFTCCHVGMNVEQHGFVCLKCGNIQTWCHDFMAEGPGLRKVGDKLHLNIAEDIFIAQCKARDKAAVDNLDFIVANGVLSREDADSIKKYYEEHGNL